MKNQTYRKFVYRCVVITFACMLLTVVLGVVTITITGANITPINQNFQPQTNERQPSLVWYKTWGGKSTTEGGYSVIANNGYLYVVGITNSSGPASGDAVLLKYDTNGNLIWNRTWGSSYDDTVRGVTAESGYLYVTGETKRYGASNYDAFLLKYDRNGNLIWNRTWGGSSYDSTYSITAESGYLYIAGGTWSYGAGLVDSVLLKYDMNGNIVWNKTWGGSFHEHAFSITTEIGHLYITGYTESYGAGSSDVFLLKYDTNGNLIWNKTWGGSDEDWGLSVIAESGYLYVVGHTKSYGAGLWDVFLLKYDTNGNLVWSRMWGGGSYDEARGVVFESGYLYVTGWTYSYGAGLWDVFLLKYDINGNLVWETTWGDIYEECGSDITTESGYLYVTGWTYSYGAGRADLFLLKYSDPIPEYTIILLPIATTVLIALIMRKRLRNKYLNGRE